MKQQTASPWREDTVPRFGPLNSDQKVDVCIIGGGIAGLSCAYQLLLEGRSVVVLEDGEIGSGETGNTTAHLSPVLGHRYYELEEFHGHRGAYLIAKSHRRAVDHIQEIIKNEGIDCQFERLDGFLFRGPDDSRENLQHELEAARRVGLDCELLSHCALGQSAHTEALRFRNQAQFHPLKYLAGLAEAIRRRGGTIFTHTHVTNISGDGVVQIETKGDAVVQATAVVVATNAPINSLITMNLKQAAYRTYALAVKLPKGTLPRGLYWDTADPYHYVRLVSDGASEEYDLVIGGGEDHRTGHEHNPEDRFLALAEWMRAHFPNMSSPQYAWSGQVMEPADGIAFIGKNPFDGENRYIITGDAGNGMTHGTIGGMVISDLIAGRANEFAELYSPSRISLRALADYVREDLTSSTPYLQWFTPGDIKDKEEIAPGSGAVLREGLSKLAIYRDEHGGFHSCSAVCPHLGGIVTWNDAAKSWDCPCHGSRFDCDGKVINGPANKDLSPVENSDESLERERSAALPFQRTV